MTETPNLPADMWACGVTTFILLCGYPPFYADTTSALFQKIKDALLDFDDSAFQNLSDEAKDFIQHLLVRDVEKRYTAEQALKHAWLSI